MFDTIYFSKKQLKLLLQDIQTNLTVLNGYMKSPKIDFLNLKDYVVKVPSNKGFFYFISMAIRRTFMTIGRVLILINREIKIKLETDPKILIYIMKSNLRKVLIYFYTLYTLIY